MNDPLDAAIRSLAETRGMLDALITSSESFDYPKAKVALKRLERQLRHLGRLQAQLSDRKPPVPANVRTVNFGRAT